MNPSIPPGRPGSWDDFVADCRACTACPLHASRTQSVVWRGAVTAPLMFIGEGPGREEDLAGIPFVGRAGRLLDTLLVAQGFPPESFHIGNIVKCRPPENRNPEPDEVASCEPFMLRQVESIRPKVIVALGTFAAQALLRTSDPISRLRGRLLHYGAARLIPTFHPAYLLRSPERKREVWEDMKNVRAILRGDTRA